MDYYYVRRTNLPGLTTQISQFETTEYITLISSTESAPTNSEEIGSVSNQTIIIVLGSLIGVLIVGLLVTWMYVKKLRKSIEQTTSQWEPPEPVTQINLEDRKYVDRTEEILASVPGRVSRDHPYYEYVPGFNDNVDEVLPRKILKIPSNNDEDYDHLNFI